MSAPEQLGRLRRIRRIGAGGFATVWLYRDDELESDVAVKCLADNWAGDPTVRERFLAESRLLRRARSPHLVHVHDVGVTGDDTPYFVMSYADLGTVADLVRPGVGVGPDELVDLVTQAAEGLAALHATGIVHRDIKPANLLLASDSSGRRRLMVADLGVAKAISPDGDVTRSVGTPSYMAPEQMDDSATLDARADVYALGAVAWALLTGQPPRARRRPGERPVPVTSLRAVPPVVDRVVMRAMEPEPDDRWPDVRSFARALADACRGVAPPPAPTAAPRGSPPTAAPPAARRKVSTLALAAASALVVVLAVALGVVLLRGGAAGSDDYEQAFEEAGVDYVRALQEHRCDDAAAYDPDLTRPEDVCDPAKNLHLKLARCLDVDGPVRVDMIGENRARVVFVGQGYVELVRGENTLFRAGFMVGSC
ncbi:hypothetical protein GCM10009844_43770 [Nocardioides koreensis]|uniref:non-specific serine/threonine protein kinase n=1 Tax=Nocardioides koreensis TaxID=433651 RepID=A0ABP5M100_9ACTN